MELDWVLPALVRIFVGQLLLSGGSRSRGQEMPMPNECPTERWCRIDQQYANITVRKGQSGTIVCTIPSLAGANVFLLNQYGNRVLAQSARKVQEGCNFIYHFNVAWTEDKSTQERLRVIQCIANFQGGGPHPCRTPMVNIDFASGKREFIMETKTIATTTERVLSQTTEASKNYELPVTSNEQSIPAELLNKLCTNHASNIFSSLKTFVLSFFMVILTSLCCC